VAAQLRVLRRQIRTIQQTKKITKAQELIATSRIARAQARVQAARPYATEITSVLTELAANASLDHPLLVPRPQVRRSGVLVVTSDRGLAGGYNANALRRAEELIAQLRAEGSEPVLYVIGRKGVGYYRFRDRPVEASWTGFSENPTFADAREVGDVLYRTFLAGADDAVADVADAAGGGADDFRGVDELHLVSTHFISMITQRPQARRIAPMVIEDVEIPPGITPLYEFEPEPGELLRSLLPRYIKARIYASLLDSAAAESAARRTAMKSASDNADDLIKSYTRVANQARQAQITQEISEIVGGANALASAGE
jgi:F-type H+-transporting ATPase subunit gamma